MLKLQNSQTILKTAVIACTVFLVVSCRNTDLPSINILKETHLSWDKKEPCKVVYSDKSTDDTLQAVIKLRGGSSSSFDKHSFTLELDKKYKFGDLPEDDDWILNAGYIDKTFMRHKVCYDIFRQMNSRNVASESSFINLSINNDYEGLYILMEEINAKSAGLDKSDSLSMIFKDPPVFYREKLKNVKDSLNYYHQKFPKIYNKDNRGYMEHFKDFLFNAPDSEFVKNIARWVDIENVMDWHILLLFSNNSDGIMKNFFLYKIDSDTPFRLAIWDYDHSFGRDGDNELNPDNELDCNRSVLLKRLLNIRETGYSEKIKKRWKELRESQIISAENFRSHIERNDRIIRSELEKNFAKWPVDSKWYYDANTYSMEIELMVSYAIKRIEKLDQYFITL